MYFASKGLFIRKIRDSSYVIQDIFGTCSLPFQAKEEELNEKASAIAKVQKLVTINLDSEFPDLSDFRWNELEHYYITHIDYALLRCLINGEEAERYHSISRFFPIGYLELGYGDGSKSTLEFIHNTFKKTCNGDNSPIQEKDLELFLTINQARRICKDIMSLSSRSISAYTELLRSHRQCIAKSHHTIEPLGSNEIIHHGPDSYKAASAVTSLVITLCSSLDLSAKLVQYLNSMNPTNSQFKPARDIQYHDIKKIKPKFIPENSLKNIIELQNSNPDIPEIIQFRNDLVHSTSAIELEKIYIGIGTPEINEIPLVYSAQYARDCLDSGQPIRFLGRDYFVEEKMDIEIKVLSWIHRVFEYHLGVAKEIHHHLSQKADLIS